MHLKRRLEQVEKRFAELEAKYEDLGGKRIGRSTAEETSFKRRIVRAAIIVRWRTRSLRREIRALLTSALMKGRSFTARSLLNLSKRISPAEVAEGKQVPPEGESAMNVDSSNIVDMDLRHSDVTQDFQYPTKVDDIADCNPRFPNSSLPLTNTEWTEFAPVVLPADKLVPRLVKALTREGIKPYTIKPYYIYVMDDPLEATAFMKAIVDGSGRSPYNKIRVVGVDCETAFRNDAFKNKGPPSMVQIAFADNLVGIFQIYRMCHVDGKIDPFRLPAALRNFLESSTYIKTGVGITSDLYSLHKHYNIKFSNIGMTVDTSILADAVASGVRGLAALTAAYCGETLNKHRPSGASYKWDTGPAEIGMNAVLYAANDARASLKVYKHIIKRPSGVNASMNTSDPKIVEVNDEKSSETQLTNVIGKRNLTSDADHVLNLVADHRIFANNARLPVKEVGKILKELHFWNTLPVAERDRVAKYVTTVLLARGLIFKPENKSLQSTSSNRKPLESVKLPSGGALSPQKSAYVDFADSSPKLVMETASGADQSVVDSVAVNSAKSTHVNPEGSPQGKIVTETVCGGAQSMVQLSSTTPKESPDDKLAEPSPKMGTDMRSGRNGGMKEPITSERTPQHEMGKLEEDLQSFAQTVLNAEGNKPYIMLFLAAYMKRDATVPALKALCKRSIDWRDHDTSIDISARRAVVEAFIMKLTEEGLVGPTSDPNVVTLTFPDSIFPKDIMHQVNMSTGSPFSQISVAKNPQVYQLVKTMVPLSPVVGEPTRTDKRLFCVLYLRRLQNLGFLQFQNQNVVIHDERGDRKWPTLSPELLASSSDNSHSPPKASVESTSKTVGIVTGTRSTSSDSEQGSEAPLVAVVEASNNAVATRTEDRRGTYDRIISKAGNIPLYDIYSKFFLAPVDITYMRIRLASSVNWLATRALSESESPYVADLIYERLMKDGLLTVAEQGNRHLVALKIPDARFPPYILNKVNAITKAHFGSISGLQFAVAARLGKGKRPYLSQIIAGVAKELLSDGHYDARSSGLERRLTAALYLQRLHKHGFLKIYGEYPSTEIALYDDAGNVCYDSWPVLPDESIDDENAIQEPSRFTKLKSADEIAQLRNDRGTFDKSVYFPDGHQVEKQASSDGPQLHARDADVRSAQPNIGDRKEVVKDEVTDSTIIQQLTPSLASPISSDSLDISLKDLVPNEDLQEVDTHDFPIEDANLGQISQDSSSQGSNEIYSEVWDLLTSRATQTESAPVNVATKAESRKAAIEKAEVLLETASAVGTPIVSGDPLIVSAPSTDGAESAPGNVATNAESRKAAREKAEVLPETASAVGTPIVSGDPLIVSAPSTDGAESAPVNAAAKAESRKAAREKAEARAKAAKAVAKIKKKLGVEQAAANKAMRSIKVKVTAEGGFLQSPMERMHDPVGEKDIVERAKRLEWSSPDMALSAKAHQFPEIIANAGFPLAPQDKSSSDKQVTETPAIQISAVAASNDALPANAAPENIPTATDHRQRPAPQDKLPLHAGQTPNVVPSVDAGPTSAPAGNILTVAYHGKAIKATAQAPFDGEQVGVESENKVAKKSVGREGVRDVAEEILQTVKAEVQALQRSVEVAEETLHTVKAEVQALQQVAAKAKQDGESAGDTGGMAWKMAEAALAGRMAKLKYLQGRMEALCNPKRSKGVLERASLREMKAYDEVLNGKALKKVKPTLTAQKVAKAAEPKFPFHNYESSSDAPVDPTVALVSMLTNSRVNSCNASNTKSLEGEGNADPDRLVATLYESFDEASGSPNAVVEGTSDGAPPSIPTEDTNLLPASVADGNSNGASLPVPAEDTIPLDPGQLTDLFFSLHEDVNLAAAGASDKTPDKCATPGTVEEDTDRIAAEANDSTDQHATPGVVENTDCADDHLTASLLEQVDLVIGEESESTNLYATPGPIVEDTDRTGADLLTATLYEQVNLSVEAANDSANQYATTEPLEIDDRTSADLLTASLYEEVNRAAASDATDQHATPRPVDNTDGAGADLLTTALSEQVNVITRPTESESAHQDSTEDPSPLAEQVAKPEPSHSAGE
ncbi:hypothetical protein PhCBS80983_g05102 [Powellomyces hirtus]|uniref:3'-5' exonuclease n=1 Tax=Powellomyces hirtus TaxID=109895 RepID=A0A507DWN0_9FUNG|nr:hypothetical protein PhCBS80983_g05102 [Powellomyces hirtus]